MNEYNKIEELCEALINEDPNFLKILGNTSQSTQKIIRKIASDKNSHNNDTTSVISRLILKYFDPDVKIPNYILGPVSLLQMENPKYPHIFYIFGDIHDKKGKCYHNESVLIPDFLSYFVKKTPVFTDVYLEAPYKYEGYKSQELGKHNYLLDNHNMFFDCLYNKDNFYQEKCSTSRFHYVDIRKLADNLNQVEGQHVVCTKDVQSIHKWGRAEYRDVYSFFSFILNKKTIIYERVRKQFSNIEVDEIREKLVEGFNKCTSNPTFSKKDIPLPEEELEVVREKIKKLRWPVLLYTNCILDYYTLARIFKKHKKFGKKYSWPSYNNLLYIGDTHRKNMKNILKELGFKIKFFKHTGYDENNYQCLETKDIKPFFYQRYE